MKQQYKEINFSQPNLALIFDIDRMIRSYQAQGYTLSVRQLYYQLVARDLIPNTEQSYKRIAGLINDARMAGYIDWDAIEDRNRDIEVRSHWTSGKSILEGAAAGFHMDMWDNQEHRVFVIVEKAALAGVLGPTCRKFDVPLLAARGYPSVSIVREMALEHLREAAGNGQYVTVLHLGDHDPSGLDMTRDLEDRFELFLEDDAEMFTLHRIALSMDQIEERKPPPNPAKSTDSRFKTYARDHGDKSWELDSLDPSYIADLVTGHIEQYIDDEKWEDREKEIEDIRERLIKVAKEFPL